MSCFNLIISPNITNSLTVKINKFLVNLQEITA